MCDKMKILIIGEYDDDNDDDDEEEVLLRLVHRKVNLIERVFRSKIYCWVREFFRFFFPILPNHKHVINLTPSNEGSSTKNSKFYLANNP